MDIAFKLFKSRLHKGRMGWLGGLGPCDIARSINQPFSYTSCSIIFLWGVCGNSNNEFSRDIYRQIMDYETFQTGWFMLLNDYKDPQSP